MSAIKAGRMKQRGLCIREEDGERKIFSGAQKFPQGLVNRNTEIRIGRNLCLRGPNITSPEVYDVPSCAVHIKL